MPIEIADLPAPRCRPRGGPIPWVILLSLLAMQALLVATYDFPPPTGDEPIYIARAKPLRERGALPRATPEELAVERNEAWGNTAWRPPGYFVFVAAMGGDGFDGDRLHRRVAAVQFATLALAICGTFAAISHARPWMRMAAAVVLGVAPWPYEFVTLIGPDSFNASFLAIGLLLLWRSVRSGSVPLLFAGALVVSATILLRPEMLAVAPAPIAVALLLHRRSARAVLAAGAALLLVLATQYAYRTWYLGELSLTLFGEFRVGNEGAYQWANTWVGTEQEAYGYVYTLLERRAAPALPARAFANAAERRLIESLHARTLRDGYSAGIDRAFAELAATRQRADPLGANLIPRLWHATHLWMNLETNAALLQALSQVSREVRRPIYAGLLLLKLALLGAFLWRLRDARRLPFVALFASVVVTRTILVGLVLDSMMHRHMVVAWLPLIAVVFSDTDTRPQSVIGRVR
jgi:hypothetical protein